MIIDHPLYRNTSKVSGGIEARRLQDYIHNHCVLQPIWWLGPTFRRPTDITEAYEALTYFFTGLCFTFKRHIHTITSYNTTYQDKLLNDIHSTVLVEPKDGDNTEQLYSDMILWMKHRYSYGRLFIERYDPSQDGIIYQQTKHIQSNLMTFCNGKGVCKNKNRKGKNKNRSGKTICKYWRNPHLLDK